MTQLRSIKLTVNYRELADMAFEKGMDELKAAQDILNNAVDTQDRRSHVMTLVTQHLVASQDEFHKQEIYEERAIAQDAAKLRQTS